MSRFLLHSLPATVATAVLFGFAEKLTEFVVGHNNPLNPVTTFDVINYLLAALLFSAVIIAVIMVLPAVLLDRLTARRKPLGIVVPLALLLGPALGVGVSMAAGSQLCELLFRLCFVMAAMFVGYWCVLWLERAFFNFCRQSADRRSD